MRYPSCMKPVSMKARVLGLALVLSLAAFAQTPKGVQSQVQASTGTATFTASTQLVVEQVSVKGKEGKPVEGLKKEDFTITEDNKPQEIKFFDYEKLAETPSEAPAPALQTEHAADVAPLAKLTRTQIASEPKGTIAYKDRRL